MYAHAMRKIQAEKKIIQKQQQQHGILEINC